MLATRYRVPESRTSDWGVRDSAGIGVTHGSEGCRCRATDSSGSNGSKVEKCRDGRMVRYMVWVGIEYILVLWDMGLSMGLFLFNSNRRKRQ